MSANGGERRSHFPLLIGIALVIGGFVLLDKVLPNIDLQQALEDISRELGDWTYVLVGLAAFLETGAFVGLVLPGETAVILGGAVAGQGETSIVLTIGVVWACAMAGDSVSFLLGRRLGRDFLLRHGPKVRITRERFARVESYFSRHGGKTIVIGRFIGLVRALAPFVAGSSGMRYAYYLPFSVLGRALGRDVRADRLPRRAEPGRRRRGRRPGHAPVRDRGGRDRRDRARGALPARAAEPQAPGGGDGAPRRASSAARGGAPPGASGALPVGAGDARASRARVHDPARGPRGRLYVVIAYTVVISGDPGPDAGRSHRVRRRRSPADGVAHGYREDRHRARLRRRQPAARGAGGPAAGGAAALGRGRRAGGGGGDHLHRGRRS